MAARHLWVPGLVAALVGMLLAVLVAGPLRSGGKAEAVEPRETVTRTITIPPEAFSPTTDDIDFTDFIGQLTLNSGTGVFVAPLSFEAPVVSIRRITLYAWDDGGGDIILLLYRGVPAGPDFQLGGVESSGASASLRSFTERDFTYRQVADNHGPYLWLSLPGNSMDGYGFYGAKLTYSYETGS